MVSCRYCRAPLLDEIELDHGTCCDCADRLYERSKARDEWGHFHDEPCPEIELPPMPRAATAKQKGGET